MEVEGVRLREIVPELLEFESGVEVSGRAEEGDHLSEEDEAGGFAVRCRANGGERRFRRRR